VSCAIKRHGAYDVRFGSLSGLKPDIVPCPLSATFDLMHWSKKVCLFDHLVGSGNERRWDLEAESLGGFEIDCGV
jgi:hypothetical protein